MRNRNFLNTFCLHLAPIACLFCHLQSCTGPSCVTWWSCEPPWSWVNLFSFCEWASSCVSGAELGCRCRSGWRCPSLCTSRTATTHENGTKPQVDREGGSEKEVSPGVVLSVVWGLRLAGASVPGRRVRWQMPAAPGTASLSEVCFVPWLFFLSARCVRVSPWRCWWAPMVRLTPTGALVTLGSVPTFSPRVNGSTVCNSFSREGDKNFGLKSYSKTQLKGLLSLVARGLPFVSVVVLGVGWVTAVSRGALILASVVPSPPWRLRDRAPYGRAPSLHIPDFSWHGLAPVGGAVEPVLFQQCGSSQQVELL